MTDEPQPTNGGYMSAADVTGLLSLMDVRLGRMEDRILARLDLNSAGAAERWAKHDADLATNTKRISERFMKIESALDADIALLNAHLAAEHDAALVTEARIKPVRMSLSYVEKHWRTIVLWIVMILTLLGVTVGRLHDFGIGP